MHLRLISCCGMLLSLTLSLNVSAATAGTEVALFTPWSFIQKKVKTALTANTLKDAQTIAASDWNLNPWTPHLQDLQWEYKTKLELVEMSPQIVHVRTDNLAVSIKIQKFTLDQVIEREIDGAVLRIRIQAQCGPIVMSQANAQLEARFAYDVQPQKIATRVEKFALSWEPNSWQVNDFTCQGPSGFDETIKQEIALNLASAEKIRPWIENLVGSWVQGRAAALVTQLASPIPVTIEKNNLVLQFRQMENTPEGVLNRGVLAWSGNPAETNVVRLGMGSVPESVEKRGVPVFISPSEGWTNLIAFLLQKRAPTFDISMASIKTFKELLASPSQQSAVWPDLQNYTTASRFNLSVTRPRAYSLSWRSDGTADVQSPAAAMIQSERNGRKWNYIALSGSVSGRMSPSITAGKLNAAVRFSKSRFTPKFDAAYVAAFSPNTTLDARVLDAFSAYVNEGFTYSAALPAMDLGIAGKASFTSWSGISKDLIALNMDLKSLEGTQALDAQTLERAAGNERAEGIEGH